MKKNQPRIRPMPAEMRTAIREIEMLADHVQWMVVDLLDAVETDVVDSDATARRIAAETSEAFRNAFFE
jgi:hypothetical protein